MPNYVQLCTRKVVSMHWLILITIISILTLLLGKFRQFLITFFTLEMFLMVIV